MEAILAGKWQDLNERTPCFRAMWQLSAPTRRHAGATWQLFASETRVSPGEWQLFDGESCHFATTKAFSLP